MQLQAAFAHAGGITGMRKVWKTADRARLNLPMYSLGEEIFSAVSHGVAAAFGAVMLILQLIFCEKTPVTVVSVSIFGGSMVLLYTVSTLYHALGINKAKQVFRVLDHCTIFLLIAGTYTPITLCCLKGIAGLLTRALGGRTPEDILATELYFIDRIGIRSYLSPTRANGLGEMLKQMHRYALAFSVKK